MPHYSSYDSFKTKKSMDKKRRAKEKAFGNQQNNTEDKFIVRKANNPGTVIEVRYNDAYVLYKDEVVVAKLRKGINAVCNKILFPGDKVVISDGENGNYTIDNLVKRKSLLTRVHKDSTRSNDIGTEKGIAANVDTAVIVVAAKEPPLHSKFIDRYLMILQNSNIPSIICLNKSDLATKEEEQILDIYRKLNIPVVETSTLNKTGIEELKKCLKGKQTIFVGNSGVGKSSLTNALMDVDEIKTSHVSRKSKRGRHTTTTSKYYVWDDDSSIIDTPGIRSLDVSDIKQQEVQNYFQEFQGWADKCKFSNCLHYKEPEKLCMVKQGVKAGAISSDRYASYVKILQNVLNEKKVEHNEDISNREAKQEEKDESDEREI